MGSSIIVIIVAAIVILFIAVLVIARLRRRRSQDSSSIAEAGEACQQLYVGNLSYRVHERDLRHFFSKYGEISHLKVVKDRDTRRSKGFGFVTFSNAKAAESALQACHGATLSGRNIVVRFAKPR